MMTPLDDDLLTALREARPDPGYQPSATSPEASAMLARIVQARHGAPRLAAAERDLPAGRQHTLREHLINKLRRADNPLTGRPATRRRTPGIIIAAATAAGLAAAGLTLLPGNTSGASPAATQLLAKIAVVAARQPSPPVRDSQFWYIKSWVAYQVCNGGSGNNCVMQKPHESQVWQSVSNLCVTGLARENGQNTPLAENAGVVENVGGIMTTVKPQCPDRGHINAPTYRFLQSLPTNPRTLLNYIYAQTVGEGQALGRNGEAFVTIGDLLRAAIAPPQVSAAIYRAAALIPGVTVVANATDAIGRHGVAVAMTYQGVRTEWIFSKQTLQYLGERDINTANGSTTGEAAVLQRAFVDHAGQTPG
jgi:hypothetical protein